MGTIPMHELFGLPEDDYWSVFKHRAFGNKSEERPSLVKIGKEIFRKCKGNPLAAKTLGSLLRSKSEEKKWVSVKESELWNLPQGESSILPALKLSYLHLSIKLRRCFAFCAMFPKDYRIVKETLIHLWIANDLISSKGNMEVEEIGNKICKELYSRSFFQDAIDEGLGCFKMHDLVHDLAQSIMEDECHVIENYRPVNLSESVCHLMWSYSDPPFDMVFALCKAESLRTLMLLSSVKKIKPHKFLHGLDVHSLRAFVAVGVVVL
ncbi:putative disease resistance protein RGA3 [Ziziphus jujuba]|uniref:Disease resistance protein RGA3 n=1 Tax=Ziziphus jujuba TaxID=326968 RepID=A0ABM4AAS4_ZIZJJ|nr:putative disease resistance protein RGA3 [Ziziphus jujuba]